MEKMDSVSNMDKIMSPIISTLCHWGFSFPSTGQWNEVLVKAWYPETEALAAKEQLWNEELLRSPCLCMLHLSHPVIPLIPQTPGIIPPSTLHYNLFNQELFSNLSDMGRRQFCSNTIVILQLHKCLERILLFGETERKQGRGERENVFTC